MKHPSVGPTSSALALVLAATVAVQPMPAAAQTQPLPPAGVQTLPTREQVQAPVPDTLPGESQVRVDGNQAFRETACPFATASARVAISTVIFTAQDGTDLPSELWSALADIGGEEGEQPLSQICDIRDAANAALRQAGYVASVQIPPQEIVDGRLRLSVITARLVRIDVQNAKGRYGRLIASRAERLKALDPFNQYRAERILLLAGDVPGLDVQLTLAPAGTVPGEVIGTLTVAYRPFALTNSVQNYSAPTLGRETVHARAEVYGLTGLSDLTYAGFSSTFDTDEQQVVQVGHSFSPDGEGTRIEGNFSYAWSRPDVEAFDIRSESAVGSIAVTSPFIRSSRYNANATTGLDIIEQRTRVFFGDEGIPLTRDKLRVGFFRLTGNYSDPDNGGYPFALSAGLEVRRGLDIFGATGRGEISDGFYPSRLQGDPEATVVRFDLDGQFTLAPLLTLSASVRAQKASDPLLNYEQFSVGTLTVGRGYDPGAVSGDSAFAVRNELRAALYRDRSIAAEVYSFFDYAWLWNHPFQRLDGQFVRSSDDERLVRSVGFGTRLSLPGNLFLDASYARPLDPAPTLLSGRPADRLLVSLTAQFSPEPR